MEAKDVSNQAKTKNKTKNGYTRASVPKLVSPRLTLTAFGRGEAVTGERERLAKKAMENFQPEPSWSNRWVPWSPPTAQKDQFFSGGSFFSRQHRIWLFGKPPTRTGGGTDSHMELFDEKGAVRPASFYKDLLSRTSGSGCEKGGVVNGL